MPLLQQHHKEPDGYRGIALLLVVFYHYFDGLKVFRAGWLGVDLLFVLSGFLVTGRLIEHYAPQKKWAGFWAARAFRVLPPLLVLLFAYFFILPHIAPQGIAADIRANSVHKWWYFSFTENWLFVRDGYPAIPHLAFLWTIAVQVQFYLLLFIIVRFTRNLNTIAVVFTLLAMLSFIIRTNLAFETSGGLFAHYMYNTFCRIDTFAGGVLLYCLLSQNRFTLRIAIATFITAIMVLSIIVLARRSADFSDAVMAGPGIFFFVPAAVALFYFIFTKQPEWAGRVARFPFFVFCGRISYGLYLFHIPIFTFFSGRIYSGLVPLTGAGQVSETLAALVCLLASFGVAWGSARFIEQPLLNYKNRFV
ncbi:MAG: acyltransferase [Dinghuibacter sp.]|nr:acyltransferase [Dinghuibacter sp.]